MSARYEQLVPVVFGEGAIRELGREVAALGCRKIMLVCDGGVRRAGVTAPAEESLRSSGVDFAVFERAGDEPTEEIVNACGAAAIEEGADGFVAVGGGSCMDCAKAAALLLDHPGPIGRYFTAPPSFLKCSVPVVLVPTTAGSGSEVTQVAVITRSSDHAKPAVFMRSALAIVDPELTYSAPPSVTRVSGLDALTHAAEAITAKNANPRSELLASAAIGKIVRYLPDALENGRDRTARRELALASNWAGIAFQDTDCHLGHCMADGLSMRFHTPHGFNCILVEPELMAACAPFAPEKVRTVGEALGLSFAGGENPEQIGRSTAAALRAFARRCGVKSPRESGMAREDFLGCAELAMELDLGLRLNCPFEPTADNIREIYARTWDGD